MCKVRRLQYGNPTALGPASTFIKDCIHFYQGCKLNTNEYKPQSLSLVAPVLTTFDNRRSGFKLPCKVHHTIQDNICTYKAESK